MREKMNNKKIAKIAVIILIVSALSLFFTQGKALAYGTWQGSESSGMPQKKVLSGYGSLLPNIKKIDLLFIMMKQPELTLHFC